MQVASAPFDSSSRSTSFPTDTIIKMGDNVLFYCHRDVIKLASDRLGDLCLALRPSTAGGLEFIDGLPVIPIPEDAEVVRLALQYIHPKTPIPILSPPKDIISALQFHQEYGVSKLEDAGLRALEAFIACDAVLAFHIAMDFGVGNLAHLASQRVLQLPLYRLHSHPFLLSRPNHQALVRYHVKC
ncbi:hypothetical protein OF83DRAFT_1064810, partial [Amylostereum chailletii]